MRINDIIITAFNEIKKNLFKSFMTMLEIIIVLSLIILLSNFTTTISKNSSRIIKNYYSENTSTIDLSLSTYRMDMDEARMCSDLISRNYDVVEGVYYNVGDFTCLDYRYLNNLPINLVEGTLYNNSAGIYISSEKKKAYEEENGIEIELFNSYTFEFGIYTIDGKYGTFEDEAMVIGIYDDIEYGDYIVDHTYPLSIDSSAGFNAISVVIKASKNNYKTSIKKIFNIYDNLKSRIDDVLEIKHLNLKYNYNCNFINDYNMVNIFNLIINTISIVISVLFIFFATLAIISSVNISLEERKDIIGIEKAYGMKSKDFYLVNACTLVLEVIASLLISFIISLSLIVVIRNLADKALKQILYSLMCAISYKTSFEFGIYLLLITVGLFIIFSLVFIRSSLKKKYNSKVTG